MNNESIGKKRQRPHAAWVVALTGAIAAFCGLGLGRFAFGMMLPSMSNALNLDYGQGSLLGFANLLGYLIAVLIVPAMLRRFGTRSTVTANLLVMALSMFAMVLTENYPALCFFYLMTGIGSGGVVLPAMSLMSQWFAPSHRGLAAGVVMAGPGVGIILTGFVVPNLVPLGAFEAWQTGWLIFGAGSAVTAGIAYAFMRNHPKELGLTPFGRVLEKRAVRVPPLEGRRRVRLLAHLGVIFGIYGATYMIYVSFIVTSMVDSYGMSQGVAGRIWAVFGVLSIFSGVLFGWISDRGGRRFGLAVAFAVLAIAYVLVGFTENVAALYVSVGLFGIAAWSVPVIMAAATGDYFGPIAAPSALAISMIVFSAGQSLGPVLAGFLAERSGSFMTSYASSGAAALIAIVLTGLLRAPDTVEE